MRLIDQVEIATFLTLSVVWRVWPRRQARPWLLKWAVETRCTILATTTWGQFPRGLFLDRPPSWWRAGAYPFRVRVRNEGGEVEEGWVLCLPGEALAVWDSGRIRETTWCDKERAQKPA